MNAPAYEPCENPRAFPSPRFVPVTVGGRPCVLDLATLQVARSSTQGRPPTVTLARCNAVPRIFLTFTRCGLVPGGTIIEGE